MMISYGKEVGSKTERKAPRATRQLVRRRNLRMSAAESRLIRSPWLVKLRGFRVSSIVFETCSLTAARYDDLDDVISLYSLGVSLNAKDSQGRTALHMAAANGHLNIVEYLVRNGVDVNASNNERNTPLHWACLNGKKEVVKALILAGANVSLLNSYERTPMDEAVTRGDMAVVDAVNVAVAHAELQGVGVN